VSATDVAMQQVPPDVWAAFERRLDQAQVPSGQRPDYLKWVRFYSDFCAKYGHSPALPTSLGPFLNKLAAKNQSVGQRSQASAAVRLLIQADPKPRSTLNLQPSPASRRCRRQWRNGEFPSRPGPHARTGQSLRFPSRIPSRPARPGDGSGGRATRFSLAARLTYLAPPACLILRNAVKST
jgi:hypothetical protein